MTSAIFCGWLRSLNDNIKRQKRKILLLLDNASCHTHLKLSNVRLVFFPPNLTARIQPMDQGVIATLKKHYRRMLVEFLVMKIASANSAYELCKSVTVLDAINWIQSAWDEHVKPETIQTCFSKAGIKDRPAEYEIEEVDGFGSLGKVTASYQTEIRKSHSYL